MLGENDQLTFTEYTHNDKPYASSDTCSTGSTFGHCNHSVVLRKRSIRHAREQRCKYRANGISHKATLDTTLMKLMVKRDESFLQHEVEEKRGQKES